MNALEGDSQGGRFTIRPLTACDLDAVLFIEAASFPCPWLREMFEAELDRGEISRCFAAVFSPRPKIGEEGPAGAAADPENTGEISGYIMSWLVADELYITNLAVSPSRRRSGVADRLIGHALQDARTLGASWCQLEVRVSNTPARSLYSKYGFREIGARKGYYQDGENAIVMGIDLSDEDLAPSA